jgi:hypothetical protein
VHPRVGLDLQATRTAIAVAELPDPDLDGLPVGDGCRALIPNAVAGTRWGSAAVDPARAPLPRAGAGPDWSWPTDPTTPEFLAGACGQVRAHLGLVEQGAPAVIVVTEPGDGARQGAALAALTAAGVAAPVAVDPADALLHHWARRSGSVVNTVDVIAAGQRWTVLRRYDRDPEDPTGWRRNGVHAVLRLGCLDWTDALAREVLQRCPETDPATTLVHVEDAVLAFADALRAAEGRPVRWWGALRLDMDEPFALSAARMRAWPQVDRLLVDVGHALTRLPSPARGPAPVVLGGPGAAWPFLAERLAELGRPPEPVTAHAAHDLALAAAGYTWLGSPGAAAAEPLSNWPDA